MRLNELRDALAAFITARLDDAEKLATEADQDRVAAQAMAEVMDSFGDGERTRSVVRYFSAHRPKAALSDITARRRLLAHLLRLADQPWTGSYAVQEEAVRAMQAMAAPFEGEAGYLPEFTPRWAP